MNQVKRWFVWLSRIHRCCGFGIQSPTDYAFVRYVVNEHWPYYAYDQFKDDDWMRRKLGKLYFRLANWKQPSVMLSDDYEKYWHAGCRKTRFESVVETVELVRVDISDGFSVLDKCNEHSVLIVEGIYRDWQRWKEWVEDERVGVTFDLYYCGIVFFDKKRYKFYYVINF